MQCSAGGISSALAAIMAGCMHAFLPRYSPTYLWEMLQRYRVSATIAVPTMLIDVLAEAQRRNPDTSAAASLEGGRQAYSHAMCAARDGDCDVPAASSGRAAVHTKPALAVPAHAEVGAADAQLLHVRKILVGAGTLQADVLSRLQQLMPRAAIWTAYGMTECASSVTFRCVAEPPRRGAHQQNPARHALHGGLQQRDSQADDALLKALGGSDVGPAGPGIQLQVKPFGATCAEQVRHHFNCPLSCI